MPDARYLGAHGVSSEGTDEVTLTRNNLPWDYHPLPNVGFLLLWAAGVATFGTTMVMMAGQDPRRALIYGLPLGLLFSLPFVLVWMKNASHTFRLPPRGFGLFRFLGEWRLPETRRTGIVFLLMWNLMILVVAFAFFLLPQVSGREPEVGPFAAPVVTWAVIWAVGYLVWWWRLPPGEPQPRSQESSQRVRTSLWPFATERLVLATWLSPKQCQERLLDRLAPWMASTGLWITPSPERPVRGMVSGTGFSLRKAITYGNPYQTVGAGKFIPMPQGTRFELRLSVDPIAAGFTAIWFGFFLVMLLIFVTAWLRSPGSFSVHPAAAIAGVLVFISFGYATLVLSRLLARDEGDFLRQFLLEALEADEVPVGRTSPTSRSSEVPPA